ncbi:MAG: RNA 2',3'-cyclic phosphodiesterase [Planctomycetes bacterium]|nr:RNA 2',3'-cyclic phosphodiesterase [Planctomycetota bacterium]
MTRAFVALDPPEPLRNAVAALCRGVPGARWVPPEQLHLTLRFLGEQTDAQLAALQQALGRVRVAPFELRLAGPGVFPPARSRKPARVLWLGLQPCAPLTNLKAALDSVIPQPDEERSFTPHLTLARFKAPPGPEPADFLRTVRVPDEPWRVTEFRLYASELQPEGAVHRALASYALGV